MRWGALGVHVTGDVREEIRAWCVQFGLPGYLLGTTSVIGLPSQVDERECERTSWEDLERWPTYTRHGAVWVTGSTWVPEHEPGDRPHSSGWLIRDSIPLRDGNAILPDDGALDPGDIDRLRLHMQCPIDACPLPGTTPFWAVYQEPLVDILRAGRVLARVQTEMHIAPTANNYPPSAYALLQSNGWVYAAGDIGPSWTAASLLGAFALSECLQPGLLPRACAAHCGTQFVPQRVDHSYCSRACRERGGKRTRRAAQKSVAATK